MFHLLIYLIEISLFTWFYPHQRHAVCIEFKITEINMFFMFFRESLKLTKFIPSFKAAYVVRIEHYLLYMNFFAY